MEWIKCSERMPEGNSPYRVLAFTPSDHDDMKYRLTYLPGFAGRQPTESMFFNHLSDTVKLSA